MNTTPKHGERVVIGDVPLVATEAPLISCSGCHFELVKCEHHRDAAEIDCGSRMIFLTEATFALKRLKGEV